MAAEQKKTLPDIFVEGAKKGWNVGISSIIPNVLMAFVLIHALRLSGLLDMLGTLFNPVMGLFGLPGQAVMVLVGAWMSMGGGVGVAAVHSQSHRRRLHRGGQNIVPMLGIMVFQIGLPPLRIIVFCRVIAFA